MECKIIPGGLACDNRGSLRYVNDFDFAALGIKRMYHVENNTNCPIRAWHGHLKESKAIYCAKGSAIIGAIEMGKTPGTDAPSIYKRDGASAPQTFVVSSLKPGVLYIPAGMANGFRMLEPDTILIIYSTSTLADSSNDDYRFPFGPNDNTFDIEVR